MHRAEDRKPTNTGRLAAEAMPDSRVVVRGDKNDPQDDVVWDEGTRPLGLAREQALGTLVIDELTHADTQALGVPLPHPQHGDKRLRALCEAVLRAPAERATLAEWAEGVGASERTVARLFRDELGLSYQQWRQQAVLAHALPLLARGLPISQVAAATGYASDSAFSAMFKAAMGQPPSQFQV